MGPSCAHYGLLLTRPLVREIHVIVKTLTGVSIELLVLESWLELTGTQAPANWAILDQAMTPREAID
jgi:hypothetical protein